MSEPKSVMIDGVEVFFKDARSSVILQPLQKDIDNSEQGDPTKCPYALCAKRMFHSKYVRIYDTRAYIHMLDERGKPEIARFVIKNGARDWVKAFDKSKRNAFPAGCTLYPPSRSQRLDYQVKRQARRRMTAEGQTKEQQYREAYEMNKILGIVKSRKPRLSDLGSFRSGMGQVHFSKGGYSKLTKHIRKITKDKLKSKLPQ